MPKIIKLGLFGAALWYISFLAAILLGASDIVLAGGTILWFVLGGAFLFAISKW
jgi:hypothetical protein